MKDWAKQFHETLKPLHTFERGDRVVPSKKFLSEGTERDPASEGTVRHSKTASVYVQWDDGAFMLMHYESITKINS